MKITLLLLLSFPLWAAQQPCPATLTTDQALADTPKGWRTYIDPNTDHHLVSVSFYEGDPVQMAHLAPDNPSEVDDPAWTFSGKAEIWQVCRYAHTKLSLTKSLGRVKRCTVKYNKIVRPQVDGIDCR